MQYKAVIFDFFGVICSEIGPIWFEKHFSKSDAIELKEKYARPVDLGEVTEAEFFQQIAGLISKTPKNVREEWLKLVSIDSELIAFISVLRRQYKIGLCSNAPAPFLREIIDNNNLASLFDVVVISSEVHIIKPENEIFQLVLEGLGVARDEAVFIDDSAHNVASAQAFGIKSLL